MVFRLSRLLRSRAGTLLLASVFFLALAGCNSTAEPPQTPEVIFFKAKRDLDQGNPTQGFTRFEEVIFKYPETKYANFAYLMMADAQFESGIANLGDNATLNEALANYENFLRLNPETPMAPYVMFRMIFISHVINVSGFFTRGNDVSVLLKIEDLYKRFFLLYPRNSYFEDSKVVLKEAREKLAVYEITVGDWYFDQKLYGAALARYNHVLNRFPELKDKRSVVEKLIRAYRLNRQNKQAEQWERIYEAYLLSES